MEFHFLTTRSVEQTRAFAQKLAQFVQVGDVITLDGDLGAGKTHFVQGLGDGLGIATPITSPTFTLLNIYDDARLPVYHFDLYRLNDPVELEDIGFYDYIEADGVSCIEWAARFPEELPQDYLALEIKALPDSAALKEEFEEEGETRGIMIEPHGPRSEALMRAWLQSCTSVLNDVSGAEHES